MAVLLGHTGFDWLQWLGWKSILPFKIANAEKLLCASCQISVAQQTPVGKRGHVIVSCMTDGEGNVKAEDLFLDSRSGMINMSHMLWIFVDITRQDNLSEHVLWWDLVC